MSELGGQLARLGLSQYLEVFVSEGFDTWETLLDITESDLGSLSVKLGHRRKLQRAIAESRGQSSFRPLPIALEHAGSVDGSYRSDDSTTEHKVRHGETPITGVAPSAKRKYRRHPKPDEHAPERPPSAYVIFSNQVRETLRGQELSFTEIAKIVGERWQVLPADSRDACERQANSAKEKYYAELAEYKKRPEYESYQKYLEEFKAKHAAPPKEGKRAKLEGDTTASTRISNHDQTERAMGRRISSAQSDHNVGQNQTETSPPMGPSRLPSGPAHSSKSTSPAVYNRSGLNSPRICDQYSPLSASPRPATLNQENSYETTSSVISTSSAMARDARGQTDASMPYSSSSYSHGAPYHPSTTPPSYGSHYHVPVDLPSRRSNREMHRLPPLSHEDTTLSSDSGLGGYTAGYIGHILPSMDASNSMRVLPTPIPSAMASVPSPLDRPSAQGPPKLPLLQHADYRTNSSLAALLRAGELARVADTDADNEDMDTSAYP